MRSVSTAADHTTMARKPACWLKKCRQFVLMRATKTNSTRQADRCGVGGAEYDPTALAYIGNCTLQWDRTGGRGIPNTNPERSPRRMLLQWDRTGGRGIPSGETEWPARRGSFNGTAPGGAECRTTLSA